MFNWIYDMPTWTMVMMVTGTLVGVTWVGIIFVRPILNAFVRSEPSKNNTVSCLLGSHGTFFGILLGLLALSAYQNLSETDKTVTVEASRLAAMYRDISAYPEPTRSRLQRHLREYARFVIEEAWPLHARGSFPQEEPRLLRSFRTNWSHSSLRPRDKKSCTPKRCGCSTRSSRHGGFGSTPSRAEFQP